MFNETISFIQHKIITELGIYREISLNRSLQILWDNV